MSVIYQGGGFGESGLPNASRALLIRSDQEESDYQKGVKAERREREERAELQRQASVAASIADAWERGEVPTRKEHTDGVGRTHAEAVAYYDAKQQREDREAEKLRRKQLRQLEEELDARAGGESWPGQHAAQQSGARAITRREAVKASRLSR